MEARALKTACIYYNVLSSEHSLPCVIASSSAGHFNKIQRAVSSVKIINLRLQVTQPIISVKFSLGDGND